MKSSAMACTAAAIALADKTVMDPSALGVLATLVFAILAAGCATVVRIQPLATGRPDVAAYNLSGPSLEALSQELTRLCPAGQQVLRQSQSGTRMVPAGSSWQQSLNDSAALFNPPDSQAQVMVVCHRLPATQVQALLSPQTAPQPVPTPARASVSVPALAPVAGAVKQEPGTVLAAMLAKASAATTGSRRSTAKATQPVQPPVDALDLEASGQPSK